MAITPVGSLAFQHNSGTGNPASVDVPDGADTDLEVAIGGSNFFDVVADGFGPPSGSGWTLRHTVDRGPDDAHLRCWTRTAPAGAHTVTLASIGGEECWLAIRRLAGADLDNPIDDVDGATSANGNHSCPALTLSTEAYLLGAAQTQTFEGGSTYTPPSGFTELQDFSVAGSALGATVAEDQAAGPGSVGPFTFVYASGDPGCALVVAIRAASAGGPVDLDGSGPAAAQATGGLSALRPAVGDGSAASTAAGGLHATRAYSAEAPVAADASGSTAVARSLTGASSSASFATGAMAASRPLSGSDAAAASGSAGLAAARPLSSAAPRAHAATGALTVAGSGIAPLAGTVAAASAAAGATVILRHLAGSATTVGGVLAATAASRSLAGTSAAAASITGRLVDEVEPGTVVLLAPALATASAVAPRIPTTALVAQRVPTAGGAA